MRPLRTMTIDQLRARRSIKWSLYGPDVLPLWVAEMDAPIAPAATRVLTEIAESGDLGYPDDRGYGEAFTAFARRRWAWDPDFALPVADVMTGVVEALRIAGRDVVIVNPPVYPPFFDAVELAGARPVEVRLAANWRLDLDRLAEAFAEHAGAATYLLCHPHNPTALPASRAELEQIARLAADHDVHVVVDEIHAPLADPDSFIPYLSVSGTERAFAVTSASKAWNLAGAKAGLLVSGADVAASLRALPELVAHGASQVGVRLQIAAWTEGVPWLDALRADLAENRELVRQLAATFLPRASYVMGDGSYLAWFDLSAYGLGDDPAVMLRERAGVALGEGLPFGGGPGFARLNYATTPEILGEAFERLGRICG